MDGRTFVRSWLAFSRDAPRDAEGQPNMDGVRRNVDLIEHLLELRRRQMI